MREEIVYICGKALCKSIKRDLQLLIFPFGGSIKNLERTCRARQDLRLINREWITNEKGGSLHMEIEKLMEFCIFCKKGKI